MAIPSVSHALTVRPIWADAILRGPKRIENRSWLPGQHKAIALHAGAHDTPADIQRALGLGWSGGGRARGALVAVLELGAVVESSDDPWFFGPYGWTIVRVHPVVPVAMSGRLGLWRIPPIMLTSREA